MYISSTFAKRKKQDMPKWLETGNRKTLLKSFLVVVEKAMVANQKLFCQVIKTWPGWLPHGHSSFYGACSLKVRKVLAEWKAFGT
jgi:hypothetical protein